MYAEGKFELSIQTMKRSEIKRRPLADTVLATLEPEDREYREPDGNGLYFKVRPNGQKLWELRYKRADGKWSWLGMGTYPDVSGALARQRVNELKTAAAKDGTPLTAKRLKKAADIEAASGTFEKLAREWHTAKSKTWASSTASKNLGALENHVFPVFGQRLYTSITPMEWMEFLRAKEQTGIIEQTSRIRSMCAEIYDLARVTGRAIHNPLEGLHRFLQTNQSDNYAHVSVDELPALVRAIRSYPHARDVNIGLQLLCMLACRPSELRNAVWSEFDLGKALWLIPAERMKRRREHLVPLPRQAVTLLRELYSLTGSFSLLFPGRGRGLKPRSNTVFLMALRRLGYQGRQTGHGFRHIASTVLNEKGFDHEHVEAQLSHVKEGVRGIYDKSIYLKQRKAMMQWYADFLDRLTGENVVQLQPNQSSNEGADNDRQHKR